MTKRKSETDGAPARRTKAVLPEIRSWAVVKDQNHNVYICDVPITRDDAGVWVPGAGETERRRLVKWSDVTELSYHDEIVKQAEGLTPPLDEPITESVADSP